MKFHVMKYNPTHTGNAIKLATLSTYQAAKKMASAQDRKINGRRAGDTYVLDEPDYNDWYELFFGGTQ